MYMRIVGIVFVPVDAHSPFTTVCPCPLYGVVSLRYITLRAPAAVCLCIIRNYKIRMTVDMNDVSIIIMFDAC